MATPAEEFHAFFERHHAELSRLAHLLLGGGAGPDGADDLAADALVALWSRWDRVQAAEQPLAYARGVVVNLARSRIRTLVRERRRVALFWAREPETTDGPDIPAVLDVRAALGRLPYRKRACVVLRHAFGMSEKETARALGISVGTVKSQTSRGIAELERLLEQGAGRPAGKNGGAPAGGGSAPPSAWGKVLRATPVERPVERRL
ncbi:SigE family RNA polymerase sigma factor [Streptomyces sp. YIM 98790]|uniref:SigE family RNA polymerase sigma factor n=1 Tax=Streptomyces sp. YIM 98790 TaxID=2689077 RepID=UPI0028BDDB8A|nr:SigE family RNA polymerase sigma factor [Streptomyces sp. YIM 98790]